MHLEDPETVTGAVASLVSDSITRGRQYAARFLCGAVAFVQAMSDDRSDRDVGETVAAVLADHPVAIGILFGSRGRGDAREHSDVDVIDLERASPSLVRAALDEGRRLAGSEQAVRRLRDRGRAAEEDAPSPADRFDDVLAAIDDHLA